MTRLDLLAHFSDDKACLTRLFLTPAHKMAALQVKTWMEEAGMIARIDAVGNVSGHYEGTDPRAPALIIGSHIDTVRDAGKYDGCLGVIAGIEAIARINAKGRRLPFPIQVVAFGDEEGVRFPVTLTGSKAISGTLDSRALNARDNDGMRMRDALAAFGAPPDPAKVSRAKGSVRAYLEVHIEQGPVLEDRGLPVGIVTAIAGATRATIRVTGSPGHVGTVPMALRRDAGAAAAEMALAVERVSARAEGLLATVGTFALKPGAVNVIPGEAVFTIDMRSGDDTLRTRTLQGLREEFDMIATRRGVGVGIDIGYEQAAAQCDAGLVDLWAQAMVSRDMKPFHLASGAGHDGLAMIALCPIAMLFVRCRGGISHSPEEAVDEADVAFAIDVLVDVIGGMADAAPAERADAREHSL